MTLRLFTRDNSFVERFHKDLVLIDLHVHTRRYSLCAETLDPDKISSHLKDQHLKGVVLTEHDSLWDRDDIQRLNENKEGIRFYRGVEVTSEKGHFVVIGLNDLREVPKGVSVAQLMETAHDQGAAVILPHPHLMAAKLSPWDFERIFDMGLDGIEVISTITTGLHHERALSLAENNQLTAVGGSDAHALSFIGATFTVFEELPLDEAALAGEIKKGGVIAGRFE